MGFLRLFLALIVVWSHGFETGERTLFGQPISFFLAPIAVTLFYMISGFYMQQKLSHFSTALPERYWKLFYIDRALRIYPTFVFCFGISLISFLYLFNKNLSDLPISFLGLNLSLLPTAFYYLLPQVFVDDRLVIPVSPSLALEELFFLVLPLIAPYAAPVLLLSLGCFLTSVAGLTHPYYFSYVGLPGSLFLFLSGYLLSRDRSLGSWAWLTLPACLATLIYLSLNPDRQADHLMETAVAYPVGVLILTVYCRHQNTRWLQINTRCGKIDRFLGTLSYPVFLLHWIAVVIGKNYSPALIFPLALALALPVNFIESFIQSWRRRFIQEKLYGRLLKSMVPN